MKKILFPALLVTFFYGCSGLPNGTLANPVGKVIVNEEQYVMTPDELEWGKDNVVIRNVGASNINELANQFPTLEVEKEELVKFNIDQNPLSVTITQWNEDSSSVSVNMEDNQIKMPAKEGYYIYELKGIWDKGRASFIFDVEVQ